MVTDYSKIIQGTIQDDNNKGEAADLIYSDSHARARLQCIIFSICTYSFQNKQRPSNYNITFYLHLRMNCVIASNISIFPRFPSPSSLSNKNIIWKYFLTTKLFYTKPSSSRIFCFLC